MNKVYNRSHVQKQRWMNDGQGTNDVSRLESYVFVCMNSCMGWRKACYLPFMLGFSLYVFVFMPKEHNKHNNINSKKELTKRKTTLGAGVTHTLLLNSFLFPFQRRWLSLNMHLYARHCGIGLSLYICLWDKTSRKTLILHYLNLYSATPWHSLTSMS